MSNKEMTVEDYLFAFYWFAHGHYDITKDKYKGEWILKFKDDDFNNAIQTFATAIRKSVEKEKEA